MVSLSLLMFYGSPTCVVSYGDSAEDRLIDCAALLKKGQTQSTLNTVKNILTGHII